MSDNPLNLLKEELENDDVNYIYNKIFKLKIIDSNKSKCYPQISSYNGCFPT